MPLVTHEEVFGKKHGNDDNLLQLTVQNDGYEDSVYI